MLDKDKLLELVKELGNDSYDYSVGTTLDVYEKEQSIQGLIVAEWNEGDQNPMYEVIKFSKENESILILRSGYYSSWDSSEFNDAELVEQTTTTMISFKNKGGVTVVSDKKA